MMIKSRPGFRPAPFRLGTVSLQSPMLPSRMKCTARRSFVARAQAKEHGVALRRYMVHGTDNAHAVKVKKTAASNDFMAKLILAWHIFFPNKPKDLSPKDEVKKRLRMILVADRCGMSLASLSDMKKTIIGALSDFIEIESEEEIEVSISSQPEVGTVYCVAIPVARVKASNREFNLDAVTSPEGVSLEWDPTDVDSDPSARFPMGC
jgi:septum formation topological specificity factor MinE